MPIYEYFCARCGEFEVTQRITEEPLKRCPTCRGKVRKLISASSFHLKGSGWYLTDYARSGSGKSGNGEAKEASGGTAETKSESKKEDKATKAGEASTAS